MGKSVKADLPRIVRERTKANLRALLKFASAIGVIENSSARDNELLFHVDEYYDQRLRSQRVAIGRIRAVAVKNVPLKRFLMELEVSGRLGEKKK